MDISEDLKLENEKAALRRAPTVFALRVISSNCRVVCRATVRTFPLSACNFIKNFSTLSIFIAQFHFTNLLKKPYRPSPLLITESVRLKVQVTSEQCVQIEDVLSPGIIDFGIL